MLNTIEGTGTIKINGKGLKITQANDENTVNCAFAELPETTDDDLFRLVIATRNGNPKAEFGVVRAERIAPPLLSQCFLQRM